VWIGKQKVADLFSQDIEIEPFDKVMLEWDFDIAEQLGLEYIVETYTVKVERGKVERKVTVEVASPVIARGIELEVDEQTSYLEVESIIRDFPWVTKVRLEGSYTGVDLYTGKQIPEGKKVLHITIVYQSFSHALTGEEVGIVQEQMLAALYQELGAS
jgi:phenylalanyl-tRNA synthetase beta chain